LLGTKSFAVAAAAAVGISVPLEITIFTEQANSFKKTCSCWDFVFPVNKSNQSIA